MHRVSVALTDTFFQKAIFRRSDSATTAQCFMEGRSTCVVSIVAKTLTLYFRSSLATRLFAKLTSVLSRNRGIGNGCGIYRKKNNIQGHYKCQLQVYTELLTCTSLEYGLLLIRD